MNNILENYYKKIIRRDLLNKFSYNAIGDVPKLKKIILNFGCKNSEIKNLAASLLAIELIGVQKGVLTQSRHANVLLKIRKGHPVGCVIVLKKDRMYDFLMKLLIDVFPTLRDFKGITITKKWIAPSISFTIKDLISFKELEKQFYLFANVPPLNITVVTNTKTKTELVYLLDAFKLPITK